MVRRGAKWFSLPRHSLGEGASLNGLLSPGGAACLPLAGRPVALFLPSSRVAPAGALRLHDAGVDLSPVLRLLYKSPRDLLERVKEATAPTVIP